MNYTEMLFNRDERLVNLLNQADSKNLELIEEINNREDEIERLKNIIDKALGIANERVNYYHHINKKEILEDWENIFDVLVERDNQELKGSDKE